MGRDILTHERLNRLEFLTFLSKGGVNVDNFDQLGNKTLNDLYQELHDRDVSLVLNQETGRITRYASSVKILIRSPERQLIETWRKFRNGNLVLTHAADWSVSETRRRDEFERATAVRGLREELGIELSDQTQLILHDTMVPFLINERKSRVYPGLFSAGTVTRFELTVEKEFGEEEFSVNDNGTEIGLKWFEPFAA